MVPKLQLPLLDDVITKIKQLQPLSREEELVYLIGICRLTKEEALLMLEEEPVGISSVYFSESDLLD